MHKPVLERDHLLVPLHRALADARVGNGGIALVAGEAGSGKTTLIREFVRQAAGPPRVVVGGCDPLSSPRPMGPLIDAAAVVAPDLARRLTDGMTRAEAYAAVGEMLERTRTDVVVVVEDAHWADEATLDVLTYLGRRVSTLPVLVVLTFRDDETPPHHPLRLRLGDIGPAIRCRLRVEPLSLDAVARLAQDSRLDAAALHRVTRGNAFYVSEVIASGRDDLP